MKLLTCDKLTLGYYGNIVASNISFSIEQGDYLCIIGENGAGKSTLMRSILGLQKVLSGTITYSKDLKATEIGYLPQQTNIQNDFPASVMEIVLSGCLNKKKLFAFYNKSDYQKALDCLERLEISNLANKSYLELSGGQKQRVLLARALCATQTIVFLDEPVAGLDAVATEELYQTIADLHKSGVTIIMISHDINSALKYATHILHLGEKIFFCKREEYEVNIND